MRGVEPFVVIERCPDHDKAWVNGHCACGKRAGHDDRMMSDEEIDGSTREMEQMMDIRGGVSGDLARRSANVKANHLLCRVCNGTGNRLFGMYQRCQRCSGSGRAPVILS